MKLDLKIKNRFWSKVEKTKDCWKWIGCTDRNGYGFYNVDSKNRMAHRFSWVIHFGEIPKGLCVLHRCDNPSCVNPNHLWLGTKKDNTQDMLKKGRGNNAGISRNKGEKHGSHKLREKDIKDIRKFWEMQIYTQTKMAKVYGVSQVAINRIVNRKTWKHI